MSYEVKVLNNGEVVDFKGIIFIDKNGTQKVMTNNALVVYEGDEGSLKHYNLIESVNVTEKKSIENIYQETIKKIKEVYLDNLSHINVIKIVCTVDEGWAPNEKSSENSKWKINIKKNTSSEKRWNGWDYELCLRRHYLDEWTDSQLHAAILSQLLRVHEDGYVINYSEDFHSKLATAFGDDYLDDKEQKCISDVLETKIDLTSFKKAPKAQLTIDEIETPSEATKESAE